MIKNSYPGAVESPFDPRDYSVEEIGLGEYPEVYMPDTSKFPVYEQGRTPACGGHSGAWLKMFLDWQSTGEIRDYSPRFVYAMCKRIDGFRGDGTHIRAIFDTLRNFGVLDESRFPNQIDLPTSQYVDASELTQDDFDNAAPRAISYYAFVKDKSFEGLKQAIYNNGAVLVLKKPWVPQYASGHFFVLTGYDRDRIRYTNSFGTDWGDKGQGYLTKLDMPTIIEAATAVDLDDEIVKALQARRNSLLFKIVSELQKAILKLGGKPVA